VAGTTAKPLSEVLIESLAQWLYEQADRGLPQDIQDMYLDPADALLDLLAYLRGYEEN
jgi:hypothetical protein